MKPYYKSLDLTKGKLLEKFKGYVHILVLFKVIFGIHESIPLDSNLESTNPGIIDSNLTNPMASLVVILL